MKEQKESRKSLLLYLERQRGNQAKLARAVGVTISYMTQFKKKYPDAKVVFVDDAIDRIEYTVVLKA